jgi:hypothetical protein
MMDAAHSGDGDTATPRTDAEAFERRGDYADDNLADNLEVVPATVARQLERDLNHVTRCLAERAAAERLAVPSAMEMPTRERVREQIAADPDLESSTCAPSSTERRPEGEIEHLAWHVCESAEEDATSGRVTVDAEAFKALSAALPMEHPPHGFLPRGANRDIGHVPSSTERKHVCGVEGFNSLIDGPCPGCAPSATERRTGPVDRRQNDPDAPNAPYRRMNAGRRAGDEERRKARLARPEEERG